jgi:hypothetical protein
MRPEKVKEFFAGLEFRVETKTLLIGYHYTVVRASLIYNTGLPGRIMFAEGVSRRSYRDKDNMEVGFRIAQARALDALYKKYTRKDHSVHKWYHA